MSELNNSVSSGNEKKHLNIDDEHINAFSGRKNTEQILEDLLNEIKDTNFRKFLGLKPNAIVTQKHLVFGVVKKLLEVSIESRWILAKVYEFIYLFNGCYWQQLDRDELKWLVGKAAIKMGIKDYYALHYEFKDNLLKQFLTAAHRKAPKPKSNTVLINLLNGTFEFSSTGGKIRAFDPDDFLTNQLPFEYNPEAKCPLFDTYLLKVLPNESCRMVLQEFSGYIFTELNLEKILTLTGNGSNGKSVFFNIICALVGKENVLNFSLGMFSHEGNRAKLVNMYLNYSSEKGEDVNPDIYKALASCESMQARELYGKPFNFTPRTRHILNANELPKVTEQTDAFYRRTIIIPFETKISEEERDIDLADKIIANELPGVFNWLLIGLDRILAEKKFTHSEKIDKAIADYKTQSDSVALFLEEKALIRSTNKKESVADLYRDYKTFCTDDGYRAVSKNKFSIRLENKGFERTRLTGGGAAFFIETDFSRE